MKHDTVLKAESLELLAIREDGIYVDATVGRAGLAGAILAKLSSGHLFAFDKDDQAIKESEEVLEKIGKAYSLIHADFSQMTSELQKRGITEVDGIIMDLGVSSPQFDDGERGFSYRIDGKLDMRMDRRQKLSAWEVVNEYSVKDLTWILRNYGEEKWAYHIARKIVENRPVDTTGDLVAVIRKALPAKVLAKPGHPAKQTFQAIRMEVNQELQVLQEGLNQAEELLKPQGRLVVISFHSLEDRLVKTKFAELTKVMVMEKLPLKASEIPPAKFRLLTKKVLTAGKEEIAANHRSSSAKLRAIERL